MTREQLAALDPNKVRKDKALFALFKSYATEDAAQVFPGGKLPSGCFGCSFSKHFATWRVNFLTPKTPRKMSNSTGKTYELKDPNYRVYFKGQVLSSKSTDAEWADWVNHPESEEKRKKRVDQFETLPEDLREKKVAPKKAAAKKAAPKKANSDDKTSETDIRKSVSEEKVADRAAKQAKAPSDSDEAKTETNE